MGVQHLTFEPGELFMRTYRLYFWPQARGKVDDAVRELVEAKDPKALAPERFRDASVAVQGLPALEQLLFGEPGLEVTDTSRCRLLTAITANAQTIAAGLVTDWRGGNVAFAETTANPGADNPYFTSHREVTLALFKSLPWRLAAYRRRETQANRQNAACRRAGCGGGVQCPRRRLIGVRYCA